MAVVGQQFVVRAALDDFALIHHENDVCLFNGGETVGDDQCGSVCRGFIEGGLDIAF